MGLILCINNTGKNDYGKMNYLKKQQIELNMFIRVYCYYCHKNDHLRIKG